MTADAGDDTVAAAVERLRATLAEPSVDLLVTLGSGLDAVAERVDQPEDVVIDDVPGLARSLVPGHRGSLRFGRIGQRRVLVQRGRIHLYEGHDPRSIVRIVDVAAALGARTFVVTNAAGGLVPSWRPGELMRITDHLNLTGVSPLTGVIRDDAPVFLDLSAAYDPDLGALADAVAAEQGLTLRHGVYAGLPGPAYETPAEVAMLRGLGAHAVGMSTVLEVIAARAHGMAVLGASSITNVHGAGVATSHEEVLDVGREAAERLGRLLLGVLERLPAD